jgi:hypothetical protein
MMKFFAQRFDDVSIWPFPRTAPVQRGGDPRAEEEAADANAYAGTSGTTHGSGRLTTGLPPGRAPKKFCKDEPTDREVWRLMQASPLRQQLEPRQSSRSLAAMSPPGDGHGHSCWLRLIGWGYLSARRTAPCDSGLCLKEQYVASIHEDEDDKGNVTTRTTYSGDQVRSAPLTTKG